MAFEVAVVVVVVAGATQVMVIGAGHRTRRKGWDRDREDKPLCTNAAWQSYESYLSGPGRWRGGGGQGRGKVCG